MTETEDRSRRAQLEELSHSWVLVRHNDARHPGGQALKSFDILVVEDDPMLRRTIAFALQSEGYRVMGARDGVDALRVLDTATPWLILLDLRLPGMDGATFAAEVGARCVPARIAVVTGSRDAGEAARELGAEDYLSKPFDVADLLDLVHRQQAA